MGEKQVQIPLRLLHDIDCWLELTGQLLQGQLHQDDLNYLRRVRREINAKFEAMVRREVYTQYKTAEPDSVDRERFRQLYLNKAGIHTDYRTPKEVDNTNL